MRMRHCIAAGALLGCGLAGITLRGDIIELSDGRKISGTLSRQGDSMVIKSADGQTTRVNMNDVVRVTLVGDLTPAQTASAEWTRVSAEIKRADDLQTVIALHQKFLDKYGQETLAKDVKKSLGVYEDLAKNDGVKFRGRWMPRTQIDVTIKQWAERAKPAMDKYQARQFKEALDAARQLLADDDDNPDVLTVGGLAAYRAGNLVQAKTYFTQLAASDPSSVLAENNIAVIASVQKQPGEGLAHYTRALQVRFDNRLVLDNIAEAIHSYADKNAPVYKTLQKQFDPAEARLEAAMAKRGLTRYGATWLTREQSDQLKTNQQAAQDLLSRLDTQYQTAQQAMATMDGQVRQAAGDADAQSASLSSFDTQVLLQQRSGFDVSGLLAQRQIVAQNFSIAQARLAFVQAQHDQAAARFNDYFTQADKVKTALAAPGSGFTGTQRILDLGESENPPPPAPLTVPTTMPALPNPPVFVVPALPPAPPLIVPMPVAVPQFVPVPVPVGGGGDGGRGGRGPSTAPGGGPGTQPGRGTPTTRRGG